MHRIVIRKRLGPWRKVGYSKPWCIVKPHHQLLHCTSGKKYTISLAFHITHKRICNRNTFTEQAFSAEH
jgi:hypothetical protein